MSDGHGRGGAQAAAQQAMWWLAAELTACGLKPGDSPPQSRGSGMVIGNPVAKVFTSEPAGSLVLSPGFAGMLDALSVEDSYRVAPLVANFGTGVVGRARLRTITETGWRLMFAHDVLVPAVRW